MRSRKPHIVVFFGGTSDSRDLSEQSGYWVCQYIPRSQYRVTPVHVTSDGLWQVPLGSLPQTGSVARMVDMLFQTVPVLPATSGIERLLRQPVDAMMTVIRGAGGDDGTLHGLGRVLGIPVVGSSVHTCQQTSDKYACMQRLEDLASVPYTRRFPRSTPAEAIAETARGRFVPPVFIKPATEEGSVGVEVVRSPDELTAAVSRARSYGDVLIQERLPGTEVSVSMLDDEQGRLHVLPPMVIVPQKTSFYDHLSKRRGGRVALHTLQSSDNHLLAELQGIAEDVYRELNCRGLISVDCVVGDDATHVLEVNTVPTFTEFTPLKKQLEAAGMHPSALLDRLIRRSLEEKS